ncbi:Part of the ABC transporter complex ThiBPQ involved in thiamine import. Responsible for energy coupling to the transport system [Vibrio sp. B1FLJ16]|nr:Part of the ABC transporter complex ThiBPQ involved in thiamine import. Responsible for energy coupling to the transport system [Vibrio sp. B1FLJ16]CAE6883024.1 Part of the ABC transporter complex ThiBPQ involved in thiamine import. Responsible for energy coupling to the transport system [Vibrio sp. B1FLJ16]
MVTHHLSDAKAIATHFAFVAGGKIEAAGEISELSTEHPSQVLQAFVRAAG